jgi:hypothetical protein
MHYTKVIIFFFFFETRIYRLNIKKEINYWCPRLAENYYWLLIRVHVNINSALFLNRVRKYYNIFTHKLQYFTVFLPHNKSFDLDYFYLGESTQTVETSNICTAEMDDFKGQVNTKIRITDICTKVHVS